jgi:alpha-mannosidase
MQPRRSNLSASAIGRAAGLILVVAGALAAQDARSVATKLDSLAVFPVRDWRYQIPRIEGAERRDLDDSGWPVIQPGDTEPRRPRWLRKTVTLPETSHGYELTGGRAELYLDIGGEAQVYVNGLLAAEVQDLPIWLRLTDSLRAGEQFVVAIELMPETTSDASLDEAALRVTAPRSRPDVCELARTLEAAAAFLSIDPELSRQHAALLREALAKIDFPSLERRDQARFDASLRSAREALQPLAVEMKRYTIHLTGQSHIDMAWLWPWTETLQVVRRTFRTALQLMVRNPEFTYTQSQAAAYAWMEEKYPALFEEIKERVREGRWEIVGGMWVEPDLNLPDGESLVRQILLGKQYFQQKFGVDVRTGWNPDTFGYNWQMPQILKKSGIDYFVTTKLAHNDTNKFPYRLFWWQAPDGSRILTYFPNGLGDQVEAAPMVEDLARASQVSRSRESMYLYGVGDHGGGPTQQNIDAARHLQQTSLFPQLRFGKAQDFLDGLRAKAEELNIPVWNDELYFEYHRGVYTTQADTKRSNRRGEVLLLNAEKFASLAHLFGLPYRQQDLTEAWKLLLFNQFHDILPGSGIAPVYKDAAHDYREVQRLGKEVLDEAVGDLAAQVKTTGPGLALIVFNPLSWNRTDVVEAEVEFPELTREFRVTDAQGQPIPYQLVGRDDRVRRAKLLFVAEDVPSLGYKTFRVIPEPGNAPQQATGSISSLKVAEEDFTLENEFLKLKVGAASGLIESLYDKTNGREVLDATRQGNLLQTFVDRPKAWDAWNLDADFETVRWDLAQADSVKVLEKGPVRAAIRVAKHFQDSHITQDVVLYRKIPRVDCYVEVDWREKHILLKVAFPVSVTSRTATYEIPFGAIRRPTTRQTSLEKAKFEVPALRWADLSDESYGVSILNDSKYGYDTKGNVLRLTLLRSPTWPDPHADEGMHRFTYSIYPHQGTWEAAATARRGYELNYPLWARMEPNHDGHWSAAQSFLGIDVPSVLLTAMKKAEDDDAIILRLYKLGGGPAEVALTPPNAVMEAAEVNLLEKEGSPLRIRDHRILLTIKPYEIETIKARCAR